MLNINTTTCSHCNGTGKCQCDECQKEAFGQVYWFDGHYARCSVCGGAGRVALSSPTVECAHCNGSGKCQCDLCQKEAFGERRFFDGHYARCSVCGGTGHARIRIM